MTRCSGMFLAGAMLISSTASLTYKNFTRALQPSPRWRGVDVRRAMVIRKDVDCRSRALRNEHSTHGVV